MYQEIDRADEAVSKDTSAVVILRNEFYGIVKASTESETVNNANCGLLNHGD